MLAGFQKGGNAILYWVQGLFSVSFYLLGSNAATNQPFLKHFTAGNRKRVSPSHPLPTNLRLEDNHFAKTIFLVITSVPVIALIK
jgi:hypothetical protein